MLETTSLGHYMRINCARNNVRRCYCLDGLAARWLALQANYAPVLPLVPASLYARYLEIRRMPCSLPPVTSNASHTMSRMTSPGSKNVILPLTFRASWYTCRLRASDPCPSAPSYMNIILWPKIPPRSSSSLPAKNLVPKLVSAPPSSGGPCSVYAPDSLVIAVELKICSLSFWGGRE